MKKQLEDLKVGDTVWVEFQRGKFTPGIITGVNRASWLIKRREVVERVHRASLVIGVEHKLPKKLEENKIYASLRPDRNGNRERVFLSEQEIADVLWAREHAHRIGNCVGVHPDIAVLREIARLVGYKHGGDLSAGGDPSRGARADSQV